MLENLLAMLVSWLVVYPLAVPELPLLPEDLLPEPELLPVLVAAALAAAVESSRLVSVP